MSTQRLNPKMNLVTHGLRPLFVTLALLACAPPPASAQTPPPSPAAAISPQPRTSLQWTEMKGKRTQIFIDLHAKGQSTYKGLTPDFVPTFLIQLPGDGSVDILEYQGSGDDWTWKPVPAHITLTHPSPGLDRVEFDTAPLSPGKNFTVLFRSLNDAWEPVASSKVLPWRPN